MRWHEHHDIGFDTYLITMTLFESYRVTRNGFFVAKFSSSHDAREYVAFLRKRAEERKASKKK